VKAGLSEKNEEARLDTFEMKGLRKILRVLWTAKKTNEWVLNKTGVKKELLNTVKARKLAYYGHTMRKQGSCLEKEIIFIERFRAAVSVHIGPCCPALLELYSCKCAYCCIIGQIKW